MTTDPAELVKQPKHLAELQALLLLVDEPNVSSAAIGMRIRNMRHLYASAAAALAAQQDGAVTGLRPKVSFTTAEARDAYAKRLAELARFMLSSFDQGHHHQIPVTDRMIEDVRIASAIISLCEIKPDAGDEQ